MWYHPAGNPPAWSITCSPAFQLRIQQICDELFNPDTADVISIIRIPVKVMLPLATVIQRHPTLQWAVRSTISRSGLVISHRSSQASSLTTSWYTAGTWSGVFISYWMTRSTNFFTKSKLHTNFSWICLAFWLFSPAAFFDSRWKDPRNIFVRAWVAVVRWKSSNLVLHDLPFGLSSSWMISSRVQWVARQKTATLPWEIIQAPATDPWYEIKV